MRFLPTASTFAAALVFVATCLTSCRSGDDALTEKPSPKPWSAPGAPGKAEPTAPFVERTPELDRRLISARWAAERGDRAALGEVLASLLDDAPEDLEVQALVAHAHWLKGRYGRAHEWAGGVVKGLEPYVSTYRDDIEARQVLARARMILGDLIGAEVQLRVAIRRGLRRPLELVLWADLLLKRENVQEHESLIDTAFSDHSEENSPLLCASYSQLLIALDRKEQAHNLLEKCVAQNQPRKPEKALSTRLAVVQGLLEMRRGDLTKARAFFQSAFDANNDDIDARHNLGLVLFRSGYADDALEILREADPPPNPEFYYLLATVQEFSGDTAGAVEALNSSLEHLELWSQAFSKRWQTPFFLGRLLARKGQYGRAQQVLEQALSLEPDPKGHDEIFRYLVWARQKSAKPGVR